MGVGTEDGARCVDKVRRWVWLARADRGRDSIGGGGTGGPLVERCKRQSVKPGTRSMDRQGQLGGYRSR